MIFHDYEPKLRKNPLLFFASAASAVCTAALWYFRERLSLTVPDMMMVTGVSLMIILLTLKNYFVKKENYSKCIIPFAVLRQKGRRPAENWRKNPI